MTEFKKFQLTVQRAFGFFAHDQRAKVISAVRRTGLPNNSGAKTMKKCLFAGFAFALIFSASANVIGHWTFETSKPTTAGPLSPEIGSGTAISVHANSSAAYSNPAGNGSSESWSANNWTSGDYWQFRVDSLGSSDIRVSYDQTSSGTGPLLFHFSYSIDGTSFTIFDDYSVSSNSGSWKSSSYISSDAFSFDLSEITLLNNAPTVYFRIVDASVGTAGGGTARIDNFLVNGSPTMSAPETLPFGVTALSLCGVIFFSRKVFLRIQNP